MYQHKHIQILKTNQFTSLQVAPVVELAKAGMQPWESIWPTPHSNVGVEDDVSVLNARH